MFIIITGNLGDGHGFIGPFTSFEAASSWVNNDPHIDDHQWWIVRLESSGDALDYVNGPVPEPK